MNEIIAFVALALALVSLAWNYILYRQAQIVDRTILLLSLLVEEILQDESTTEPVEPETEITKA